MGKHQASAAFGTARAVGPVPSGLRARPGTTSTCSPAAVQSVPGRVGECDQCTRNDRGPGGGGAGRGRTRRQFRSDGSRSSGSWEGVSPGVWWVSCSPGLPAACRRFRSTSGTRWPGRPCGHRMRNPDRETTHPPATEARLTDTTGRAATSSSSNAVDMKNPGWSTIVSLASCAVSLIEPEFHRRALEPSTVVRGVPPHIGCRATDHQLRVPRRPGRPRRPAPRRRCWPWRSTARGAPHEEPASRGYRRRRVRRHTR